MQVEPTESTPGVLGQVLPEGDETETSRRALGLDLDVAFDKLAGFETADDIASFLKGYGIRAIPKNRNHCAVSEWMRDITGVEDVQASGMEVMAHEHMRTETELQQMPAITYNEFSRAAFGWKRQHTNAMKEFIQRFDNGAYPDLIDRTMSPPVGYVADGYDMVLTAEPVEIAAIYPDHQLDATAYAYSLGYTIKRQYQRRIKFTDFTNC